jgi:endonuclease YncB( thermonuclease family)
LTHAEIITLDYNIRFRSKADITLTDLKRRAMQQGPLPMTRMLISPVIVILNLWTVAVSSAPITPDEVRVIDGDTIRIHHQRPDVRLVGFNAPETRRAVCESERELGGKATGRLRDLVRSSKLDFEFVACACQPGTEGTPSCNYGRRCGTLKADGQDVGLILIRENLAVPFVCGQTRCPPTPKPWCR